MRTLIQDARYGLRMLVKNPGFAIIAVLTLALGIGANAAIFSVVNAVLLRALPYKDAERLAMIWETEPSGPGGLFPATGPDFRDWVAQNHVFEAMAAATVDGATLTGAGEPIVLHGLNVYPGMFKLLGFEPLHGRTFALDEIQPGHDHVVVLSYGLWERAFGSDPGVVGRKITLNGAPYDVIGVMPKDLQFPEIWGQKPDYWAPINFETPDWKKSRGNHWIWVMARMKPGVTVEQAGAEMDTLSRQLEKQYPDTNAGVIAKVRSLREQLTMRVKPALLVLLAAVGFLLLIACVNVVNLLLTRAVSREREVAVRLAVGSSRWRLIRQLLTESVLLFFIGGIAGLALGWAGVRLLLHAAPAGYIPSMMHVKLDATVFGFTFLIAFITGVLGGLVPAFQSSRLDLSETLKESGRSTTSPRHRSRSLLTAGEIALALVMLIGSGLAIRSLVRLLGVRAGFDAERVLTFRLGLPEFAYPKDEQVIAFRQQMIERLRALPGVQSAAITSELPLEGGQNGVVYIEGQPLPKNMWSSPLVEWCRVSPGYFHTLRIPFLKGRDFSARDTKDQPPVAIINQTMANRFWPNQDPIGKRFSQGYEKPTWITVVGEVGDVRQFGLDQNPIPGAYFPETQNAESYMTVVMRTSTPPLSELSAIRGVIVGLDKNIPLFEPRELSQIVSKSSEQQQFVALLLSLLAGVALALAAIGIYGVVAYSVAQRTHEIGIRMALGAERRDVIRLVVRQGLVLALAGIAAGLAGALAVTRFLEKLLYEIKPTDATTFALVPIGLIVIALVATYLPARRATQVDPVVALRYE